VTASVISDGYFGSGGSFLLTAKTAGTTGNYPLSVSATWDTNTLEPDPNTGNLVPAFTGPAYVPSVPATMTGGADVGSIGLKFMVLSVIYAPPGAKSSVDYGSSTVLGTTSSITSTFSSQTGMSVKLSGTIASSKNSATVSNSFTAATDNSTSVEINKTIGNDIITPGPLNSNDGIDHDQDVILVWLNPLANFLATGTNTGQWTGYSFDGNDPANEMDVVALYVAWLKNPSLIPPGVAAALARTWATPPKDGSGPGLTTADYQAILARDPFANGSTTIDPARFDLQQGNTLFYEPPAAGGQPLTQKYILGYQNKTTLGKTVTDTYTVGYSETAGGGLNFSKWLNVNLEVTSSLELKWINKAATQDINTTNQNATLSLTGPNTGYQGSTQLQLYQDNVYGTFMFAFVPLPTFNLSGTPASQTVTPGASVNYTINSVPVSGFAGNVTLANTVTGLPAGATATFNTTSVTTPGSSTLTITTSPSTPLGTYSLVVTGTSTPDTRNATLTLVVSPPADFTIQGSPASAAVIAPGSTSFTVTTGAQNGFSGSVNLAINGLPTGASATFSANPIAGAGNSLVTVSVPASTTPGNYLLTVNGTSGSLIHSTQVNLTVTAPDFSISATPTNQTVTAGGSTTYTVSTSALNGFTGSVSLGTSGLPTGATASFSPTSISGSATSTLTISTPSSTPAATYTITITGISGSINHSTAVLLTVNAATGSVTISAPANNSNQSTSVRVTASASETGTQIAQMQVWDNTTGVRLGINNGSTIDQTYTLAAGTHQIIVEDLAAGTFAVIHTSSVTITVFADGVHITAPANNASITGPVHVTGFATEAATQIAQMQVWDNTTGVRLGINNGSTIDQTYTLAAGTHQIIMEDLAAGTFAVIHTASVTVTVH
jgi:hypothetical protein